MALELVVESSNGNVTLTSYLDVQQGEGLDPANPSFTEKVFSRSLLKAGATLALENLKERELVFPLKLKATSKAKLTELVEEINLVINTPGAWVKWKDEGATVSTFLQLISGQFDVAFNYRMGQQNWLPGRLRLFTEPLGVREAAMAGVAQKVSGKATTTLVASSPVAVFTGASPVGGDAAALIEASMEKFPAPFENAAVSVLPTSSYATTWPTASATLTTATTVATANALAGSYVRVLAGSILKWTVPSQAFQYAGPNRVLMLARASNTFAQPSFMRFEVPSLDYEAFPATVTAGNWRTYDLGVVTLASAAIGREAIQMEVTAPAGIGTASGFGIAGLVVLPDDSTAWLQHNSRGEGVSNPLVWNGIDGEVTSDANFPEQLKEHSGAVRGALPAWKPSTQAPIVGLTTCPQNASLNAQVFGKLTLLERCRYVF